MCIGGVGQYLLNKALLTGPTDQLEGKVLRDEEKSKIRQMD